MTITVQKVGGTNPFTQQQKIDAVSQNSITIGAPNNPDENVTINRSDLIGSFESGTSRHSDPFQWRIHLWHVKPLRLCW